MSHARKHVTLGALDSFPVPEGEQQIVKVTEMRGGNVLEVEQIDQRRILCLLPAKFKKTIWIKRGHYLIIEPFLDVISSNVSRLQGRVVHILFPQQIKYLKQQGIWPSAFEDAKDTQDEKERTPKAGKGNNSDDAEDDDDAEEDDEDGVPNGENGEEEDPYLMNPNHQQVDDSEDSSEEDWEY